MSFGTDREMHVFAACSALVLLVSASTVARLFTPVRPNSTYHQEVHIVARSACPVGPADQGGRCQSPVYAPPRNRAGLVARNLDVEEPTRRMPSPF